VNCRQAEDLIIDYLYDELKPESAARFRRHLDECPECAARASEFSQVRSTTLALARVEPSRMAVNRVLAVAREEAESSRSVWGWGWFKILAPLCLMAVVGGLVLFQLRTGLLSQETISSPAKKESFKVLSTANPKEESPKEKSMETAAGSSGAAASSRDLAAETKDSPPVPSPSPSPVFNSSAASDLMTAKTSQPSNSSARPPDEGRVEPQTQTTTPAVGPAPPVRAAGTSSADRAASTTGRPSPESHRRQTGFSFSGFIYFEDNHLNASRPAEGQATVKAETAADSAGALRRGQEESISLASAEKAFQEKDYARAAVMYSRILQTLPPGHSDRPQALYGLAQAHEALGDSARALRVYQGLMAAPSPYGEIARQKMKELDRPSD